MNKLKKILLGYWERLVILRRRFQKPEDAIPKIFHLRCGYWPDLDNPKTFNEKLQWLKLHDHNPLHTTLVDKAEVKPYVAEIIGEEYIIPTLGVWDKFEDIDFNRLPDKFVLKCTHDSGGLIICKDKAKLDIKAARKKINRCLRTNYYWLGYEWPYKNVKPRIIAEPYLEDKATRQLQDYKFYVFGGVPKIMKFATDRDVNSGEVNMDFYDMDFNHLDFRRGHPHSKTPLKRPSNYNLMQSLAAKIAGDTPFVRVDFYEVNGKVYFGEITYFPAGGWVNFDPPQWDNTLGQWLTLPDKTK